MLFVMARTKNMSIFKKYKGRELEYESKCRELGSFKIKRCLHDDR